MGTRDLVSLIMAASEKVVMNGVSNIKELYPDSTVFETVEEFEAHVVDRVVEYLVDNYPDVEEYTSGDWMLSTVCNCEGDWLFLIDGEYYIMDYCDLNNEKVDDVQIFIWNNNANELNKKINKKMKREVMIERDDFIKVNSFDEIKKVINDAGYGVLNYSLGMFPDLKLYSTNKDFLELFPADLWIYNPHTEKSELFVCKTDDCGLITIIRPEKVIEANLANLIGRNVEVSDEFTYKVKCDNSYLTEIELILNWIKENGISFLKKGTIDVVAKGDGELIVILK